MTCIALSKTHLGTVPPGHERFAQEMLDRFLHTMEPSELRPAAICLYTDGVKLACQGSPALLGLQLLQGLGVRVLVCQTCLDYFGLREHLEVGEVVTMREILSTLSGASRVLHP